VYRQFGSVEDFESEIAMLRIEQEPLGIEPLIPELAATARPVRGRGSARPSAAGRTAVSKRTAARKKEQT
jgi:transcriptional repressor NrdR